MSYQEDWQRLTTRFQDAWVIPNPAAPPDVLPRTPVVLGDQPQPPPREGGAFVRVDLRPDGQEQVSIGSPGNDRIRRRWTLLLHIHLNRTASLDQLHALVDHAVAVFQGWSEDRLIAATPSLVRVDLRGAWSVAVVAVPISRDSP